MMALINHLNLLPNRLLKHSNFNNLLKAYTSESPLDSFYKVVFDKTYDEYMFEKQIEERLITAYKRIRASVKNGLAIVPVERGASGGSYFSIPAQVQLEIASRTKIIMDEHSGRILVDPDLAKEELEKIQKIIGG